MYLLASVCISDILYSNPPSCRCYISSCEMTDNNFGFAMLSSIIKSAMCLLRSQVSSCLMKSVQHDFHNRILSLLNPWGKVSSFLYYIFFIYRSWTSERLVLIMPLVAQSRVTLCVNSLGWEHFLKWLGSLALWIIFGERAYKTRSSSLTSEDYLYRYRQSGSLIR